jgi:xanthine dehydrogenase YagR molybdenum-binding subunit
VKAKPMTLSGGSMATASVIPAVCAASDQAISTLLYTATQATNSPFSGKMFKDLALTNGESMRKAVRQIVAFLTRPF